MKRLLFLIIITILTVLLNWQGGDVQQTLDCQKTSASSIVTPQDSRHHEATLTDATSLYRICNTRPQRIIPTYGSKTERTISPFKFALRQIVQPFKFCHDNRRRLETAPFCLLASCQYYVLALRHIIR